LATSRRSRSTALVEISKGIISDEKTQSFIEKMLLFIRGNFFIPDARVGWVKPSVSFLLDYIKKENIDTIITTGPPHSAWTTIGYHKQLKLSSASKAKHKSLEKQVLTQADQIIVTSSVTKAEFQNISEQPIEVITNGYDQETAVEYDMDTKFTLSHIGSLLSKRNPDVLWRVLNELVTQNEAFSKDFQLNF